MAQKKIALPERVASKVAQASAEIQQIKQSAEAEIRSIQRRQSEVIDTFAELRGIELPEDATVGLDGDEKTGEVFLVIETPDAPADADETGVSASAKTATEQGEADAE